MSQIRNEFVCLYQVQRTQNGNKENLVSADSDVYNNHLNSSSFQLEILFVSIENLGW